MPTTYGRIQEFDPCQESVSASWNKSNFTIKLYFTANEVADEKSPQSDRCTLLRSQLKSPELPKDKSLEYLVQLLKNRYEAKLLVIAERFRFIVVTRLQVSLLLSTLQKLGNSLCTSTAIFGITWFESNLYVIFGMRPCRNAC